MRHRWFPGSSSTVSQTRHYTEANEPTNPIDGKPVSPRTRWVIDRVDGNGSRNIGAVQLNESPHLSVIAVGDGTVDLILEQTPRRHRSITGYRLTYREMGTTGNDVSVDISGADTLIRSGHWPNEWRRVRVRGRRALSTAYYSRRIGLCRAISSRPRRLAPPSASTVCPLAVCRPVARQTSQDTGKSWAMEIASRRSWTTVSAPCGSCSARRPH